MQLGPIHVGPGGLWLVIFGVLTVLIVEPVDAPAIAMRYVALAGATMYPSPSSRSEAGQNMPLQFRSASVFVAALHHGQGRHED